MTRWPSLVLLALLLGAAGGARAAESAFGRAWSGLWHTPDQRAQAALDAGDPAAATRLFRDPRRKAYAELKAGRYAQAAQGFAAFDDAAAQYDRGNALARAGDLQQALQAYDAALAKDPNDRDARHNRDLVAKALAQQQPPPPKPSDKPGSSGPSGESGKSGKAGKSGSSGSPDNAASAPTSGDKAAPSPSSGASSAGAGQGRQASPATAGAAGSSAGAASAPTGKTRDGAAQARREAAAASAAASAGGAQAAGDALGAASAPAGRDAPTTEQQLAEDQWLRGIPDDPAGLLRRKFLIQHLMRQQGGQP